MKLFAGTSGYSYKEWKGPFYPERLGAADMLRFYASRLPAVEINNTFYRLPKADVLESWASQVPPEFRFTLKASRRITHLKRLRDVAEETDYLLRTAAVLGERLGAVLFQLPPNLRKDLPRLEAFLQHLRPAPRAAFEFRHSSWRDDDVLELLRGKGCAWCVSETDENPDAEVIATADWAYLRLRRSRYTDVDLSDWSRRLSGQAWSQAYVFFKHEDAGTGPRLAMRLLEIARDRRSP